MLILDQKNLNSKRLINIQKCHSSTKFYHCGLWEKRVWADYQQHLRPVFFTFSGSKKKF